jgi:hypothetical protein
MKECLNPILEPNFYTVLYVELSCSLAGSKKKHMGGQQKNFISDIVFFQHQDGMRKKVRRHFLQCRGGRHHPSQTEEVLRDQLGVGGIILHKQKRY